MAWGVPNKGDGLNDIQSIVFKQYIDTIVAGISTDYVISGCAVTAQGSPDMTVAVASGSVLSNSVVRTVGGGNQSISTANATLPRLDMVVVNSAGSLAVREGTASATPAPASLSANDVLLAVIYIPAALTAITNSHIVDLRIFNSNLNRNAGLIQKTINFGMVEQPLVLTGVRDSTKIPIPYNMTIRKWKLRSLTSTTCSIDIKKNGTSICAGLYPSLTAATFNSSSTLTGWTTSITEDDILSLEVLSNTGSSNLLLMVIGDL